MNTTLSTSLSADGSWMNASGSLVYRAVPGAGATSIGQILHFGSTGQFAEDDVHWGPANIFRWTDEDHRASITEAIEADLAIRFFSIRNPYTRCLSAYLDKVARDQSDGNRYRSDTLSGDYALYNIMADDETPGDAETEIRLFRRFMLMVWDTNTLKSPRDADIHWYPVAYLCRPFVQQAKAFHNVVSVERFDEDLQRVLQRTEQQHMIEPQSMPQFDEATGGGRQPVAPVADYYDDLTAWIVQQVFWHDFNLFGYDWAPGDGPPSAGIDIDAVNSWLYNG